MADRLFEIYRSACRIHSDNRLSDTGRAKKVGLLNDELLALCGPIYVADLPPQVATDNDYRLQRNEVMKLQLVQQFFTFVTATTAHDIAPHSIAEKGQLPMRAGADVSKPRLCVGAHLDSCPETPGADDNASGVAAMLQIARLQGKAWPADAQWELELVAFDLEENGMLGGVEHTRLCRERGIALPGMISLEMLGYCDQRPKSQQLPRTFYWSLRRDRQLYRRDRQSEFDVAHRGLPTRSRSGSGTR